jgi:hypothetical protein
MVGINPIILFIIVMLGLIATRDPVQADMIRSLSTILYLLTNYYSKLWQ